MRRFQRSSYILRLCLWSLVVDLLVVQLDRGFPGVEKKRRLGETGLVTYWSCPYP